MKATPAASVVVILLVVATHPSNGVKVWVPHVSFSDAANWVSANLPTAGQTIVFPSKLNALVSLPVGIWTVSSLILPQQGCLLFPDHSFSLNVVSRDPAAISVAIFNAPGRTPYYSGSNWATYDEQRSTHSTPNAAVPHSERVPCQYELVVFEVGKNMPKPIDMQYHESIEVGNVRFGDTIEGLDSFHNFMSSELGQFLFYNAEDTLIRQGKCANADKCPCQEPRQMDAICSNVRCTVPHCLSPIHPPGHCCPICGSWFRMDMATIKGVFNMQTFMDKLRRKINTGEVDDSGVEFHIGVDRSAGANVVQLIIVDKGEYGEKSTRMMDSLRPFFEKQFSSGFQVTHAGQPHTPLEGGQLLAFVMLTLIVASTFFSIIYVYYYDDVLLPRLRAAVRNRQFFTTPFVFARFDPNNDVDGLSVDVTYPSAVQLANEEREESAALADDVENHHASSFNNPMYEKPAPKVDPAMEVFDDVELLVK